MINQFNDKKFAGQESTYTHRLFPQTLKNWDTCLKNLRDIKQIQQHHLYNLSPSQDLMRIRLNEEIVSMKRHNQKMGGRKRQSIKKCLRQKKKWVENLNRCLSKDTETANRHVKRCSTLLIVREMYIKMAIIKKSANNKCWGGHGERGTLLHYWWVLKKIFLK